MIGKAGVGCKKERKPYIGLDSQPFSRKANIRPVYHCVFNLVNMAYESNTLKNKNEPLAS